MADNLKANIKSDIAAYDGNFDSVKLSLLESLKSPVAAPSSIARGVNVEDYSKQLGDTFSPSTDINESRAQNQSNFNKLAKTVPRVATKFVAEVAKMPGSIYGIGEWAGTGFDLAKFEESINNKWVQSIDEAHAKTNDKLFPVYKRRVVEEGGLMRQIVSPEFWATEGADGIGFLLSFMTPGAVLKATKAGKSLAKLPKVLGAGMDDLAAASINTLLESTAEGLEAAKATKSTMLREKTSSLIDSGYKPEQAAQMASQWIETDDAKRKIGKVGANTTAVNMAILIGPNMLDQKWFFNSAARAERAAEKSLGSKLGKTMSGGIKGLEDASKYTTGNFITKFGKDAAKGIAKEGFFEEGMQTATSTYFEDKELSGDVDKEGFVTGILGQYIDMLDETDMQKSIFLGSVLGGGMGGVKSVMDARAEDKALFGDGDKKGLIKLFQDNVVNRYKSANDWKDENGQVNPDKMERWAMDYLNKEENNELLQLYSATGMTTKFELAKYESDFNYMMPYFQQPGGKEILIHHINELAEKDAEFIEENLGVNDKSSEDIKEDLLKKMNSFEEIYYNNINSFSAPKIKVESQHNTKFEEFNKWLLDSRISNDLRQSYATNLLEDLASEESNLEAKTKLTSNEEAKLKSTKDGIKSVEDVLSQLQTDYKDLYNDKLIEDSWNAKLKQDIARDKNAEKYAREQRVAKIKDDTVFVNKTTKETKLARKVGDKVYLYDTNEDGSIDTTKPKVEADLTSDEFFDTWNQAKEDVVAEEVVEASKEELVQLDNLAKKVVQGNHTITAQEQALISKYEDQYTQALQDNTIVDDNIKADVSPSAFTGKAKPVETEVKVEEIVEQPSKDVLDSDKQTDENIDTDPNEIEKANKRVDSQLNSIDVVLSATTNFITNEEIAANAQLSKAQEEQQQFKWNHVVINKKDSGLELEVYSIKDEVIDGYDVKDITVVAKSGNKYVSVVDGVITEVDTAKEAFESNTYSSLPESRLISRDRDSFRFRVPEDYLGAIANSNKEILAKNPKLNLFGLDIKVPVDINGVTDLYKYLQNVKDDGSAEYESLEKLLWANTQGISELEHSKEVRSTVEVGDTAVITGKTQGVKVKKNDANGNPVRTNLSELLARPDNKYTNYEVFVHTIGMEHLDVTLTPGITYLHDLDTDSYVPLSGALMTVKLKNTLTKLFTAYARSHRRDKDGLTKPTKQTVAGLSILDAISNIAFISDRNNLNEAGVAALAAAKSTGASIEGIISNPEYQQTKSPKNRLYFVDSKIPGGEFVVGETAYPILAPIDTDKYGAHESLGKVLYDINPEFLSALSEHLQGSYFNIQSSKLKEAGPQFTIVEDVTVSNDIQSWGATTDVKTTVGKATKNGTSYLNALMNVAKNEESKGVLNLVYAPETSNIGSIGSINSKFIYSFKKKPKNALTQPDRVVKPEGVRSSLRSSNRVIKPRVQKKNKEGDLSKRDKIKLDKAQTWLAETFGDGINVTIVKGLIAGKYLGQSVRDGILLSTAATEGTEYHEAFHRVKDHLLTKSEQRALELDAQKNKDVSNKIKELKDKFPDRNDEWYLDEALAETFADFMLAKTAPSRTIKGLFNKILRYINNFLKKINGKSYLTEQLFQKIDAGKYRNAPYRSSYEQVSNMAFNTDIDAFKTEAFVDTVNKSVHSLLMDHLVQTDSIFTLTKRIADPKLLNSTLNWVRDGYIATQNILYNIEDGVADMGIDTQVSVGYQEGIHGFLMETDEELADLYEDSLLEFVNKVLLNKEDIADFKSKLDSEVLSKSQLGQNEIDITLNAFDELNNYFQANQENEIKSDSINNYGYRVNGFAFMLRNWEEVLQNYSKYLSTFKLDVDLSQESYNDLEGDGVTGNSDNYSQMSIQIDPKASVSTNLRLVLSSIPVEELNEETNEMVKVENELGLPYNIDFAKMFSVLSSKLSNLTLLEDVVPALETIAGRPDSGARYIIDNILNNNEQLNTEDAFARISMQLQFNQTFAKYDNQFHMNTVGNEGDYQSIDIRLNKIREKVVDEIWKPNVKFAYIKDGKYSTDILSGLNFKKGSAILDEYIEFYSRLGIEFSNPEEVKNKYSREIGTIASAIIKQINAGKLNYLFSDTDDNDFGGNVNSLIDIERKTGLIEGDNSHINIEGNSVYDSSLYSFLTTFASELSNVNTKDQFYAKFPQFKDNIFSENSIILRNLFNEDNSINREYSNLLPSIAEGIREVESKNAKPYSKLNTYEKMLHQFNSSNNDNKYPLVRPGDNSLERMIPMPRFISNGQMIETINGDTLSDTVKSYIKDELNYINKERFAKDKFNNVNKYVAASKRKNGKVTEYTSRGILLDMFSDIDNGTIKNDTNTISNNKLAIENKLDELDGVKSVDDVFTSDVLDIITQGVINYLKIESLNTMDQWWMGKLILKQSDGTYTSTGLDIKDANGAVISETKNGVKSKSGITIEQLGAQAFDYVVNDTFANIEQYKLFFAHPNQFKALNDIFKRVTGAVGTKKIQLVSKVVNDYIDNNMLDSFGRKPARDKHGNILTTTTTFSDVEAYSQHIEAYNESGEAMEEGDGFTHGTLDFIRETLFRDNTWTTKHEDVYQYETQRYQLYKDYINETNLEKKQAIADKAKVENFKPKNHITGKVIDYNDFINNKSVVLNSLKIQSFGPYANVVGFKVGMIKTSVGVMFPSMAIDFDNNFNVTRPNLLNMIELLDENQIGIGMHYSANKGVTTKVNEDGSLPSLYSDGREFGLSNETMIKQQIYTKYLGIQLDTGFKKKKQITPGTQEAKQIMYGAYSEGSADRNSAEIQKYLDINQERIQLGVESFFEEIGIEKTESGRYKIDSDNYDPIIEMLEAEVRSRDLAENIFDSVKLLKMDLGVDILSNREKFENMLYAVAESRTTKQPMNGSANIQVASTLFESAEFLKKGVQKIIGEDGVARLGSNELKFYTKSDGKTTAMEVYIPNYFEGILNPDELLEDEDMTKLFEILGFRIPTQSPSSIDAIVIKGFLPAQAGDIIVLPTEIVKKAGSDYDVDKLNLYKPNYYVNKSGTIVYIDPIDETGDAYRAYRNHIKLSSPTRSVETIKRDFRLMQIQNEIITLHRDILLDPENFDMLTKSIDNPMFDDSRQLIKLKEAYPNKDFSSISIALKNGESFDDAYKSFESDYPLAKNVSYANLGNRRYLNGVAKQNMDGAGAVGMAANASTFHILSSMANISINAKTVVTTLNNADFHMPVNINLTHNQNADGNITMAKKLTAESIAKLNEWKSELSETEDDAKIKSLAEKIEKLSKTNEIGEILSLFVNAAVDNAKDPILGDLNMTPATLNVALYLTLSGVSLMDTALFLSQPIIKEYVELQEIDESAHVEAYNSPVHKARDYKSGLIKILLSKYGGSQLLKKNKDGLLFVNDKTYTTNELLNNVGKKTKNVDQAPLLTDFLRYQESAKYLSDAIQGIAFDTNGFGKNTAESLHRVFANDIVNQDNFFNNYDSITNNTNTSFMSPYKEAVGNTLDGYGSLFYILNNQNIYNTFKDYMVGSKESPGLMRLGVPKDELIKIMDTWIKDFIAYTVMKNKYTVENVESNSPLYTESDVLFKELALTLRDTKKRYEDGGVRNLLIEKLIPIFDYENNYGINNIKINNKKFDKIESDQLTNDWNALYSDNKELAVDLAKFSILQSGLSNNALTFRNLIPTKLWGELMQQGVYIINDPIQSSALLSGFKVAFPINNYKNKYITPSKGRNKSSLANRPVSLDWSNGNIVSSIIYTNIDNIGAVVSESTNGEALVVNDPKNNQIKSYYAADETSINKKINKIKGEAKNIVVEQEYDIQPKKVTEFDTLPTPEDYLETKSGAKVLDLVSLDEWNSMSKEEQDNLLECN